MKPTSAPDASAAKPVDVARLLGDRSYRPPADDRPKPRPTRPLAALKADPSLDPGARWVVEELERTVEALRPVVVAAVDRAATHLAAPDKVTLPPGLSVERAAWELFTRLPGERRRGLVQRAERLMNDARALASRAPELKGLDPRRGESVMTQASKGMRTIKRKAPEALRRSPVRAPTPASTTPLTPALLAQEAAIPLIAAITTHSGPAHPNLPPGPETPAFLASPVVPAAAQMSIELRYTTFPDRDAVLGAALGAVMAIPGQPQWRYLQCQHGRIYQRGSARPVVIHGPVYAKYLQVGHHTPAGPGFPTGDVEELAKAPASPASPTNKAPPGGGRPASIGHCGRFERGAIYFSVLTGARCIRNPAILARWTYLGAERSHLGFPTHDEETRTTRGGVTGYRVQFQHGSYWYFSPAVGVCEVPAAFAAAADPQAADLGFPISGPIPDIEPRWRVVVFENGSVTVPDQGWTKVMWGAVFRLWQADPHTLGPIQLSRAPLSQFPGWEICAFKHVIAMISADERTFCMRPDTFAAFQGAHAEGRAWIGMPVFLEETLSSHRRLRLEHATLVARTGRPTVVMPTATYQRWRQAGSASDAALWPGESSARSVGAGVVRYETAFPGGRIFESQPGPTLLIRAGDHLQHFLANRETCGHPLGELALSQDGAGVVMFCDQHVLYQHGGTAPIRRVERRIYGHWQQVGGANGAGEPTRHTDVERVGAQLRFTCLVTTRMAFFCHRQENIITLGRDAWAVWDAAGGREGYLGRLLTNVIVVAHDAQHVRCEHGWLYKNALQQRFHPVPDAVHTAWQSHGGAHGQLGAPTGPPSPNPASASTYRQRFQCGEITVQGEATSARVADPKLSLRLLQVECIVETNDPGNDEMYLTGAFLDPDLEVQKMTTLGLGSFGSDAGDRRLEVYAAHPLRSITLRADRGWPQIVTAFLSPVEHDWGSIGALGNALLKWARRAVEQVLDEVIDALADAVNTYVPLLGSLLAELLDSAIGELLSALFAAIREWIEDEVFDPQQLTQAIFAYDRMDPDVADTTRSGTRTLNFRQHGGHYRFYFEWALD